MYTSAFTVNTSDQTLGVPALPLPNHTPKRCCSAKACCFVTSCTAVQLQHMWQQHDQHRLALHHQQFGVRLTQHVGACLTGAVAGCDQSWQYILPKYTSTAWPWMASIRPHSCCPLSTCWHAVSWQNAVTGRTPKPDTQDISTVQRICATIYPTACWLQVSA